jgi:hypothetical protein
MFHITHNPRQYNAASIIKLAVAMMLRGWMPGSTVLVTDEEGDFNASEAVALAFKADDAGSEKKYDINGVKVTREDIIAKLSEYQWGKKAKFFAVVDGRHRALAAMIALAYGAKDLKPHTMTVSQDVAKRLAFEGNAANELITRLKASEKLSETISLVEDGTFKREADVPFPRGTRQKLWAQAQLVVVHGIPVAKAQKLNKEQARKSGQALNVAEKVDEYIDGIVPKTPSIMTAAKVHELLKFAKSRPNHDQSIMVKFLEAIIDKNDTFAKKYLVAALPDDEESAVEGAA